VAAGQRYRGQTLTIEPDATAASYFFAAAVLLGGEIVVPHLSRSSLQGDVAFTQVLSAMGAEVVFGSDSITVRGSGRLRGIDHDFRAISDTFLTAAVLAPFADSPTIIRGIGHTRRQETDRVAAVATELKRLGVRVVEHEDALEIFPSTLHGTVIETYDDHRIAMSFSILALRQPGVRIRQPACVDKTFPDFFDRLEMLRGK
jgi:3-phosphoshikimate 1-carboxyvinyltransferase